MSRWIDEEWLENNAKEYSLGYYEEDEWATPLNVLDSAPSIDICFCKECKYWDDRRNDAWWSEEGACYLTSRLGHATYRNHDDFCSYGERKVSEIPTDSERSSE